MATDELNASIQHGSFALKGVTLSGEDPIDALCSDGVYHGRRPMVVFEG